MGNKKGIAIVIMFLLLVGTGSFVFANEATLEGEKDPTNNKTYPSDNTTQDTNNSNINNSNDNQNNSSSNPDETLDFNLDENNEDTSRLPVAGTSEEPKNNHVTNQDNMNSNNTDKTNNGNNNSNNGNNGGSSETDQNPIITPNPTEKPTPSESPIPTTSPKPTEEPKPTPSESPVPTTSPKPTEEPKPTPSENPVPTTSPKPTEEPKPTPSESPVPTTSPKPTGEPKPTSDPNPGESEDKTYENALEAVEKAEISKSEEDINKAWQLINMITDLEKKQELKERLTLLERILDSITLVEKLAGLVENATSKKEIEQARNFKTNEQIVIQVIALPDDYEDEQGNVKTRLLEKLQELSKILDDTTAPIVKGITENEFTNKKVSITIEGEENLDNVTILLNGNPVKITDLKDFSEEGTHEIIVIDKAYNETKRTFTIDTKPPVVLGITQNYYKIGETVNIKIEDENDTIIYLTKDGQIIPYTQGDMIIEDGSYTVYAEDQAGNVSQTYSFIVDRTAPQAKVSYSIESPTKDNVIATLIDASEEIEVVNNNQKNQYTFTDNGEFVFVIRDLAGNETEIKATVKNIDREAPIYKTLGMLNKTNMNTNESIQIAEPGDEIIAFVTFSEKLETLPTFIIDGKEVESILNEEYTTEEEFVYFAKYTIDETETEERMISLKVSGYADIAGNIGLSLTEKDINSEDYQQVSVIVEPGFEFVNGKTFSTEKIVIKEPNYGYMIVYNWATNEETKVTDTTYKLPTNTRYTFTLFDKDGNKTKEVTMTFDNINPEISAIGILSGKTESVQQDILYDSVTLSMIDNELKYIKRIHDDGTEEIIREFKKQDYDKQECKQIFTQGGNYHIEVIDKAGNKSTIKFSITEKQTAVPTIFSTLGILE